MSIPIDIQAFSDEELLKKYQLGNDKMILGRLLERYVRFVFLICMKYLRDEEKAKDMSMQVFEKITKEIHRFEIQHFKSWLHVLTKNECLMLLRATKRETFVSLQDEKVFQNHVENNTLLHHDDETDKEIKLDQLEKAMNTLEEGQKTCMSLFYMNEKSYKEVAEITGFTINQVKSHIQNGKRNLKNILLEKGDFMLFLFVWLYFFRT